MVFYPYFWTLHLPHLSKCASEIPTASLAALKTQELVVLHELMHAEVAGYQEPIIDIVTELLDERDLVYCDQWGITVSLPEGIIPGNLNPLAGSYAQPDLLYGDEAVGDAEWSSG
jgi:hypothetical protein